MVGSTHYQIVQPTFLDVFGLGINGWDDESEFKKKKKLACVEFGQSSQLGRENADPFKKINSIGRLIVNTPHLDGSFASKERVIREAKENKVLKEKKQVDRPTRDNFVCGACGQSGHMRTNKNCPKYGEVETSELESASGKSCIPDMTSQPKTPNQKLMSKVAAKAVEVEVPEASEKKGLKSNAKNIPLKFKLGSSEKLADKRLLGIRAADNKIIPSYEVETKSKKIGKLIISTKMKSEDVQNETPKPSVVIRPTVDVEKDQPCKKIIIKQPKVTNVIDKVKHGDEIESTTEFRKMKKITELSSFDYQKKPLSQSLGESDIREKAMYERRMRDDEVKRSKQRYEEESSRRMIVRGHDRHVAIRGYEEAIWSMESPKDNKKKKKKMDFEDDYLERRSYRNDRSIPQRERSAKRRSIVDSEQLDYAPQTKRRRRGQVLLSGILEEIVDFLRDSQGISFLFLKPVTKKEAPDYHLYVKEPMDLSTIRDKVRSMEYRSHEQFRHDMWQIAFNAHSYNDGRNPGIPPLADQLLELCDYHLSMKKSVLMQAEREIEDLN